MKNVGFDPHPRWTIRSCFVLETEPLIRTDYRFFGLFWM